MKIKPLIGVPNLGTIHYTVAKFLIVRGQEGFDITLRKQTGHDTNRNGIVQGFLKKKEYTHLFWIDSDMVPSDDWIELFKVDEDIVSGIYPINQEAGLCGAFKEKEGSTVNEKGLLEVEGIGLGFCVIKREVVEKVVEKHGMFCATQILECGLKHKIEDYVFGDWAKELGYKIYIHTGVTCGHRKMTDLGEVCKIDFK